MKKENIIVYKTADDFAKDMGLSEIEIALIREKKRLIKKLKARRIESDISQAELAKRVGSKQPAIARMESEQVSQVSMDFLFKVAMALGVSFNVKSKLAA